MGQAQDQDQAAYVLMASTNLLDQVLDHPWPGCQAEVFGLPFTWMSRAIVGVLLVGAILLATVLLMARRRRLVPTAGQNFLEAIVVFVRDTIARPALHEKAYDYLPFLTTVFVYVLSLNLIGLVPLESVSLILGTHSIGGTPTAVPAVGGALACLALLAILTAGLRRATVRCRQQRGWPMWLCALLSPVLWFLALAPAVPGVVGKAILLPMAALELVSALAKCVALMVRLCANMVAGHMLLAVLMMLAIQGLEAMLRPVPQASFHGVYVIPLCVLGSAALNLMEMLVCAIQAFIFTIMTALFLGMYAEASH